MGEHELRCKISKMTNEEIWVMDVLDLMKAYELPISSSVRKRIKDALLLEPPKAKRCKPNEQNNVGQDEFVTRLVHGGGKCKIPIMMTSEAACMD